MKKRHASSGVRTDHELRGQVQRGAGAHAQLEVASHIWVALYVYADLQNGISVFATHILLPRLPACLSTTGCQTQKRPRHSHLFALISKPDTSRHKSFCQECVRASKEPQVEQIP